MQIVTRLFTELYVSMTFELNQPILAKLERFEARRSSLAIQLVPVDPIGTVELVMCGRLSKSANAASWAFLGHVYTLAVELPQYQQNVTGEISCLNFHSAERLRDTVTMLENNRLQILNGELARHSLQVRYGGMPRDHRPKQTSLSQSDMDSVDISDTRASGGKLRRTNARCVS